MAFNMSTVGYFGEGGLGALTPTASSTVVNAYAQVTAINGKVLTLGNISDASKFTAETLILVHVAGYTGSGTFNYLGKWRITRIKAIEGNAITVVKTLSTLAGGNANALIQAITIPEYTTVTLNAGKSITCPQFNQTNGYGGVVALMCSEELIFNGGHINLNGKGLPDTSLRADFDFESNSEWDGFENYNLKERMPLNYPDGAAVILVKKMTCHEDSRIGNVNKNGEARRPVLSAGDQGGANIVIAAEEIENFDAAMISKMPSVTSGGKGKSGCYIATESCLPCDEGTYAYDRISTATRLTSTLKIKDFGDGSFGAKTNYTKQLNSYAQITAIDKTRKVFTIAQLNNNGLAKIATGALVMIHVDRKSQYQHVGRFILARILNYELNKVTVDTALDDLTNLTTSHFAFQMVAIPQFTNFTLTGTNSMTPAYENGRGGLVAIAVSDTCDLSGGKLLVEGKGGDSISTLERGLNFISNAQAAEKLPIGEGNGSVFILAKNLIVNADTRIGASWSGAGYGGNSKFGDGEADEGWGGKYLSSSNKIHGSGAGGGTFSTKSDGVTVTRNGGYNTNGKATPVATTGGNQGAHILIVADKISSLNVACLSTGGQGGDYSNLGSGVKGYRGGNGGCGYGGAGGYYVSNSTTFTSGNGGYIGGGSGRYSESGVIVDIDGGGSGSFCFVYCNEYESQDTTYLSPN